MDTVDGKGKYIEFLNMPIREVPYPKKQWDNVFDDLSLVLSLNVQLLALVAIIINLVI